MFWKQKMNSVYLGLQALDQLNRYLKGYYCILKNKTKHCHSDNAGKKKYALSLLWKSRLVQVAAPLAKFLMFFFKYNTKTVRRSDSQIPLVVCPLQVSEKQYGRGLRLERRQILSDDQSCNLAPYQNSQMFCVQRKSDYQNNWTVFRHGFSTITDQHHLYPWRKWLCLSTNPVLKYCRTK